MRPRTTSACRPRRFNISTFWYIDALARIGRAEEARELFEAMPRETATTSGCCRRTSDWRMASTGATIRRPIPWSASSTSRCGCRAAWEEFT
jgi:hypothetical protein